MTGKGGVASCIRAERIPRGDMRRFYGVPIAEAGHCDYWIYNNVAEHITDVRIKDLGRFSARKTASRRSMTTRWV